MTKLIFKRSGSRLSQEMITEWEKRLETKLPNDYIEFLLKNNGGYPSKAFFKIKNDQESPLWWVVNFLQLNDNFSFPSEEAGFETISFWHWREQYTPIPADCIIIGVVVRDSFLVLRTSPEYYGQIWVKFTEYDNEEDNTPENGLEFVANSFSEFLESLTTDKEQ